MIQRLFKEVHEAVFSSRSFLHAAVGGLIFFVAKPATAEPRAHTTSGKSIILRIGYAAGGGSDAVGRLVARHISRHLPGKPVVLTRNMPGAGSLIAANHLFNVAPNDGSEFGLIGSSVPFGALWNRTGVKFDARQFKWLGSLERRKAIALAWASSPVTTIEQAKQQEMIIGATSNDDISSIYPKVVNALLGTRYKVVSGYQGTPGLSLALERNEIQGRFGWCWNCILLEKPDWIAEGKVKIMLQLGMEKDRDLPNVPHIMEFLKNKEDLHMARLVFGSQAITQLFLAPPGTSAAPLEVLREAFQLTMQDEPFRQEAMGMHITLEPTFAKDIERLLAEVYATSPEIIQRAASIIGSEVRR